MKSDPESVVPSMPAWFRRHGYTTVSIGKVSHHPGGRGGSDWDDDTQPEMPNSWDRHLLPAGPWQHPRGWMHGLANGEIRVKAGDMDDNGLLNITDPVYLLGSLFLGGPAPPEPYPSCGKDTTPDLLGCTTYTPCP